MATKTEVKPQTHLALVKELKASIPGIIAKGDVNQAKATYKIIRMLVDLILSCKSEWDLNLKTAREGFAGSDFLKGVELFRTVKEDAAKPGRKAKVKPTDEEVLEMLLLGITEDMQEELEAWAAAVKASEEDSD